MSGQWPGGSGARETYDAYAAAYDDFNSGYMYERWTGRLLEKAEGAGARRGRLLDVGCGTGLSFLPMLDRGWQVIACDISPRMLEIAREKAGDRAELVVADMRELPRLGEFDLVWAVNDAMNYLLSGEELETTLAGMRRNLTPEGVVLFDLNTLATYRSFFSCEIAREEKGRSFVWQGQMSAEEVAPGSISEARFEVKGEAGSAHVHRQRHFPEREVVDAIEAAGLRCAGVFGEMDGELTPGVDEERQTKAVYVCRP
ncbi:MAG TPA: class I SAM-dependent methyltransferase [Solirubrobacterales bacterium]|nr:class I SAM-dependent methyltransferase [Solirubrobacterales bacterium]